MMKFEGGGLGASFVEKKTQSKGLKMVYKLFLNNVIFNFFGGGGQPL